MSTPETGVLIRVSTSAMAQQSLIESLQSIREPMRKFLLTLIAFAEEHGEPDSSSQGRTIDRSDFQAALKANRQSNSPATISRHLRFLEDQECASALRGFDSRGGRTCLYMINDFVPLVRLAPIKKHTPAPNQKRWTPTIVRGMQNIIRSSLDQHLLELTDGKVLKHLLHEQIFNGILDAAIRLSYNDRRRKQIKCMYFFANYPLYITTTTSSEEDSEIMASPDQRAMRSIQVLCRQSVQSYISRLRDTRGSELDHWTFPEYYRSIPNYFTVDIHDLCRMMRLSQNHDGIQTAVGMLRRLSNTKFEVDARDNPRFKDTFSISGGELIELRFMNSLEVTRQPELSRDIFGDHEELVPRFYSFQLDQRVFMSMVLSALGQPSTLFLSHPELAAERSGIVQRFYNWARSYVGGRDKIQTRDAEYTLYDMHERLSPATRKDNFKRYFIGMLEKFNTGEPLSASNTTITSLIYGYYVTYDNSNTSSPTIRINRDVEDPIVGDQSPHQQYLRKQAIQALAGPQTSGNLDFIDDDGLDVIPFDTELR